ncbi:hypothetical protein E3N88_09477 [Mikania micrantha]|uniref:Uncharacterized protein n=1 Tax=Mikania micrantha TaxID=192012 RepID=A0A5N6PL47_9ASTR|nr:hypothetical protein E3N88_09477 [Mikania micrantha]
MASSSTSSSIRQLMNWNLFRRSKNKKWHLLMNYDSLEEDQKEIFLDVACILKGEPKENAIRILESCRFHAQIGLEVLEQKSLINISYDGRLGMHDHIEEMGYRRHKKYEYEISGNPSCYSYESYISQLWEGGERKVLKMLKFVDLSYSKLRTFDLGMTRNLETLDLRSCIDLVELQIPSALPMLKDLNLSGSKALYPLKNVVSFLEIDSEDGVRMIGIWGMGGAGKTTVARAICDNISIFYEGISFVENVREGSKGMGLKELQRQILSAVLNDRIINVEGVSDGKNMMKRMMPHRKVLVVQGYEELSGKVVHYAAGLPLTIKVLGSFLCGRAKSIWLDTLERLKTIPLEETLKKLEISYDGLEKDYQEIFLDVACILKGEQKNKAIRMLESCGFHAQIGLEVLEEKSLLIISNNGYLDMHDHIEEMGKNIVRRLHPNEPNRLSRLWVKEEIEKILINDLGTEDTKVVSNTYLILYSVYFGMNTLFIVCLKHFKQMILLTLKCLGAVFLNCGKVEKERFEYFCGWLDHPPDKSGDQGTGNLCSVVTSCPKVLAEFVASAPLTPLLKPDKGIRPIVVGGIWRRLVSKVVMKKVGKEMTQYLGDYQFGVGCQMEQRQCFIVQTGFATRFMQMVP